MTETSANQPLPSDEEELTAQELRKQYSIFISAWGSYQSARNVLLSGYLLAHSFLIAATVLLFLSMEDAGLVRKLALLLFSVVGLVLAIQIALAWMRSINRVALFEWHLKRLEDARFWKGPKLFTGWDELRKHPKRNLVDPRNTQNQFYANWATRQQDNWWARRARIIPILLIAVYLFFLIVAILACCTPTPQTTPW